MEGDAEGAQLGFYSSTIILNLTYAALGDHRPALAS